MSKGTDLLQSSQSPAPRCRSLCQPGCFQVHACPSHRRSAVASQCCRGLRLSRCTHLPHPGGHPHSLPGDLPCRRVGGYVGINGLPTMLNLESVSKCTCISVLCAYWMLQLRSQSHSQVNPSLIPVPTGYLVQPQSILPLETRSGINHLTRKYTKLLTKKNEERHTVFKDWIGTVTYPGHNMVPISWHLSPSAGGKNITGGELPTQIYS